MASFFLPGKVALVTGAAQGIGFETARLLHERGASVAVLDLLREDAEAAAEAINARNRLPARPAILPLEADVSDGHAMDLATAEVVERFGGLDLVVANAGIAPPPRPMSAIGVEEFDRVVDVDLYGVWRTVRPALPQVIERRGHIVVVASLYAFMNGLMAAPYAMAKAGVEQLGRALRAELAPHGASAGVAYFGFIDTEMVQTTFADPITQRVAATFPSFITKRLSPPVAGAAIVDGVERRAPRMMAPRWLYAWSALRGVVNPLLDRWAERDAEIAAAVREAERR